MILTLDSSVIAKLFVTESGSEEAITLLKRSDAGNVKIFASDLIFFEVGNVILKHLQKENGVEYMKQLFSLDIKYTLLDQNLASTAMKIAMAHDITYYDAVHVAVAQQYTSILVTEDRELLKKFNNTITIIEALERIERERGESDEN